MSENTAFVGLIGFAVMVPPAVQELTFMGIFVAWGVYTLYKG